MYSAFIGAVEQSGQHRHVSSEHIPHPAQGVPLRVLLVEDSNDDAELLIETLRRGGYRPIWERVETAEAMEAALVQEPWDIVIADYVLPRFSGLAALVLMQERQLDLPFIVVSGCIDEALAVAAMRAGAHDYVMKGNLARLVPAIERELGEAEMRRSRKCSEEASWEFFKSLVEAADDAIILTDLDGKILFLNPAAKALYGSDGSNELIGVNTSNLLTPDCRESAKQVSKIVLREGVARNRLYTVVRLDGSEILVEMTVTLLRHGDGRPSRFLIIARDLTERKRAEEHLRLLETSVAHFNDMVIITHPDGRVAYVNDALERHTGYASAEVMGRTPSMLGGPTSDPQAIARVRAGLARQQNVQQELLVYRKDGTSLWIDVDISPVIGRSGELTHWVAIARNITERKALEEQLRHSQKMEAVGLLAGSMAHDFNNQLTVIKGCAQFLFGALPVGDPSRRDGQLICATVDRGAVLVRHLLAFSRRQAIETSSVDLNELVGEGAVMFRHLLGEQIELQLRLAPGLWTVSADAGQIEQVLMNIVANANDAMLSARGGGGALTVETANVEITECANRGVGDNLQPGQYVMLAVSDTGCGMSHELRERIFEPFYTTKEPGKGTGLGLSTAYGIVKQHGGHILCESTPGTGTTFRVYLPRAPAAADPLNASKTGEMVPRDQHTRAGATVLIAEDEEGVREVVGEALTQVGYAVRLADGVAEALAEAEDGPIHLLVTDLVMRDGSGPDLACPGQSNDASPVYVRLPR